MSNISPSKIVGFVRAEFGASDIGKIISVHLILRHTPTSVTGAGRAAGVGVRGASYMRLMMRLSTLSAWMQDDAMLAARIERVESKIDMHHDAELWICEELARCHAVVTAVETTEERTIVGNGDNSRQWYEENDRRFRSHFQKVMVEDLDCK